MKAAACDGQYLIEEYETLRRGATTRTGAKSCGHGLTLFVARGMYAWLEALTALAPADGREPPRFQTLRERVPVACSSWADLTTVLASMVLACAEVSGESTR
jgi:hypothetical protein